MKYKLAMSSWDTAEIEAIQKVIASDRFSMGNMVGEYERKFADYVGSKHAVMVNSGSSANLLMIASLFFSKNQDYRLERGDEVIVPSVSWSTTYAPLQQYGLRVKFVDIDKDTLNIDLDKLKSAITDKTKVILSVNLLGNPNDFSVIQDLISDRKITLLEDNCESLGAVFEGKKAGTFGLMGTYSSFFSHHMSTMEGGCITTDDDELDHILRCLRAHGWTRDLPDVNFVSGKKSNIEFEEAFKFCLPGYNVRPLEMSGAIGLEQLKKLPQFITGRRKNGAYFMRKFENHPFIKIQREVGMSSWFGFSLCLTQNCPISRNAFVEILTDNGIESRPIVTGNFLKNKDLLKYFNFESFGTHENAEFIDSNGLFVGNHHVDITEEIDCLYRVISSIS